LATAGIIITKLILDYKKRYIISEKDKENIFDHFSSQEKRLTEIHDKVGQLALKISIERGI
jgi:hypothetical protein